MQTKKNYPKRDTWDSAFFGKLIETSGVSIAELSNAVGMSEKSMYLYRDTPADPSLGVALKIADFFAVPLDALCGRCSPDEIKSILADYPNRFKELRKHDYEVMVEKKNPAEIMDYLSLAAPYPYNLMSVLIPGENIIVTEDRNAAIKEAIQDLPEKERIIIESYFYKEMSLKEIGDFMGLTRERIRQIRNKALRRMSAPDKLEKIRLGLENCKARQAVIDRKLRMEEENLSLDIMEEKLKARREQLRKESAELKMSFNDYVNFKDTMQTTIENLSLSSRSYNALKKDGRNTVEDVIRLLDGKTLGELPNIGIRSVQEIIETIDNFTGRHYSVEDQMPSYNRR